jgi:cytochrome c oxidase assembly protein subunit 15
MDAGSRRTIAIWLLGWAAAVFLVLVVGGLTRLTHSGLSIVQWQPLVGIVPPLSDAAWSELFEQYRATPEFRLLNSAMALGEFEQIFWWEYAHRLLARLAGLLFLLPLLWFVGTRRITRALAWRLAAIFALGALQGALGWFMVASGLVDDPRVSPLRLAAHLGLALLLIGAMLWSAWTLWFGAVPRRRLPALAGIAVGAVFVMALTGALVAGTRAGFAFNTFPWMGGALVPPGLLQLSPWYRNLVDNLATVQFVHRAMACVVIVASAALCWPVRTQAPRARRAANGMLLALAVQLALGIGTLLSVVALPLAGAHQAGAVLLFVATLWSAFALTLVEAAPAA